MEDAIDKKQYIMQYLTALVEKYKDLPAEERRKKYAEHFTSSDFEYDKDYAGYVRENGEPKTKQGNESAVFRLIHDGKGVCDQYARVMALISNIDNEITGENCQIYYCNCSIKHTDSSRIDGHAINMVTTDDLYVTDVSSMMHARDGDYPLDKDKFYEQRLPAYANNLKKSQIQLVQINNDKNCDYMVLMRTAGMSADEAYNFLMSTNAEFVKNYQNRLLQIPLSYAEEDAK